MEIREQINLKNYTTFGIGGRARYFVVCKKIEEVQEAIKFAKENNLEIFVLGGGSNVLVSDNGFEGLVIKLELKGFEVTDRYLEAHAGEVWDEMVKVVVEVGLQGIECLSGIPGSFGGAIVQNIGAYGQTLADRVESVEAIIVETGELKTFSRAECKFEYRGSIFKSNPGKYIVTRAVLKLNLDSAPELKYPSVQKMFEGVNPSLKTVRQGVIEIRAQKGMVIMPEYESYKSAGSFFKNPVITKEQFAKIKDIVDCPGEWHWPEGENVKVAAACLITQSGNNKCDIYGAAQISPKQPLAIINPGFATAQDIAKFAEKIRTDVHNKSIFS